MSPLAEKRMCNNDIAGLGIFFDVRTTGYLHQSSKSVSYTTIKPVVIHTVTTSKTHCAGRGPKGVGERGIPFSFSICARQKRRKIGTFLHDSMGLVADWPWDLRVKPIPELRVKRSWRRRTSANQVTKVAVRRCALLL